MKKNRWVVKLGTGLLTQGSGEIDSRQIGAIVAQVAALMRSGIEVVLVSSGAISAGMTAMNLQQRPRTTTGLQACATIGQIELMSGYQHHLITHNLLGAQLLLTHANLDSRSCCFNASRTLEYLLSQKRFLPIINENDAIASEEIKVGDNDRLSAYVATLIDAEKLVILSSIDGLLTTLDGTGKVIPLVTEIDDALRALATGTTSQRNVGGMATKLIAAEIAAEVGTETIIANGRKEGILLGIAEKKFTGTTFKLKKQNRGELKQNGLAAVV
ncbi:MAG: glutamate 5-kinase [Puniceicoccales bacterium]|jgi:glutamate 5-kinase|nr:glutamate 5-kinase [Puniceicoccales bacterium]